MDGSSSQSAASTESAEEHCDFPWTMRLKNGSLLGGPLDFHVKDYYKYANGSYTYDPGKKEVTEAKLEILKDGEGLSQESLQDLQERQENAVSKLAETLLAGVSTKKRKSAPV